ncbi:hypothetical protein [Anaerotignum sp.]
MDMERPPFLGVDKVATLRQNQDFGELKQRNKQIRSIGASTLKHSVFPDGNKFRLRILCGKLLCFPNPSAAGK